MHLFLEESKCTLTYPPPICYVGSKKWPQSFLKDATGCFSTTIKTHIPSTIGVQAKQVSSRVKLNITEEAEMGKIPGVDRWSCFPRRKCQEMVNQLVENLAQLVRAERLMEQGIPVDEAWNMTNMLANGLESPEWFCVPLFDVLVVKVQWIKQTAEQVHKLCWIWATQRWKKTK